MSTRIERLRAADEELKRAHSLLRDVLVEGFPEGSPVLYLKHGHTPQWGIVEWVSGERLGIINEKTGKHLQVTYWHILNAEKDHP